MGCREVAAATGIGERDTPRQKGFAVIGAGGFRQLSAIDTRAARCHWAGPFSTSEWALGVGASGGLIERPNPRACIIEIEGVGKESPVSAIQHEIKIAAPRKQVLEALTRGSRLARWHGAEVDDSQKGELNFTYPSGTSFRWKIIGATPDRIIWECLEGPGNSVGTRASFEVRDLEDGRTVLAFEHSGWNATDPNRHKCNTLWGQLLHQLQQHLAPTQTGTARL
jgi:uncharacterized protein YndB with AHSA1/START domain